LEALRGYLAYWLRPRNTLCLILFLVLAGGFVYQASPFWTAVIDDSYITFRFVDMFVKGHGWRFSAEGPLVEGFTNFLWAATLLLPHWLGWDLMLAAKLMGMVCALGSMAAAWGFARELRQKDDALNLIPVGLMAFNSYFAHWALMGLETLMQVLFVTIAFWRFEAERRDARLRPLSAFAAVLAAMTRIDSLFYLSPLGLYGLLMVLSRRMPVKRLLLWGLCAAIPFGIFAGWKFTYFPDLLPNTYYAKQRLVEVEGNERGKLHVEHYYLRQGELEGAKPPPFDKIVDGPNKLLQTLDRIGWDYFAGSAPSFAWINFWALSFTLCLYLLASPVLLRGLPGTRRLVVDVQYLRVPVLLLLPVGMNIYYVIHVNGDWMQSFRFFQIILPFIGVAGSVGFGWLVLALGAATSRFGWAVSIPARSLALGLALWLLVGTGYEQMRVGWIYIFGPGAVDAGQRDAGVLRPAQVLANYRRGFSPPLNDIANFLLLNTQPGSWIYMHDIGQPLWYSDHLSLYDADGLTDPYLAHAPSVRGDLPRREFYVQQVMDERNLRNPSRTERREIEREASRRDFQAHIERNANYILKEKRPEYLLIFVNHINSDPKSAGTAYPELSARIWENQIRKDAYEEDWTGPKVGNVFNHLYRRKDVPKTVSDGEKIRRILRALDRNPRMPLLVNLLVQEALKMPKLPDADRAQVQATLSAALVRWTSDPVISDLARAAEQFGIRDEARAALLSSIDANPANIPAYWAVFVLYEKAGLNELAESVLRRAVPYLGPMDNSVLYQLVASNDNLGRTEDALKFARLAVERTPLEARAWSDYADLHDRIGMRATDDPTRLRYKQEALRAFTRYYEVDAGRPKHVIEIRQRLERELAEINARLPATPPPQQPPPVIAPNP
jgi:tetratricopeptide (TPR) repeat protein